jgi:hypothetical protein
MLRPPLPVFGAARMRLRGAIPDGMDPCRECAFAHRAGVGFGGGRPLVLDN